MVSIGGPIRTQPDFLTPSAPQVAQNPFFAIEDRVSLGKGITVMGYGDTYEPWPKDPKDDFEKEKRKEWLRGEIYRLRELIKNLDYSKNEKDRTIYSLGNEIGSLKDEARRVGDEINSLDEQRASKEIEYGRTKRAHREAQERRDSEEAWRLMEQMHRLEDQISNLRGKIRDLGWKRNDIDYKVNEKTRDRERLQGEVYRIAEQISKERWILQDRETEYRSLGGIG